MSGFDLRNASVADARRIAEIRTVSWQAAYRGIVPDEYLDGLDVDDEATRWTGIMSALDASVGSMQLVSSGGAVVGFVGVGAQADPAIGAGIGQLAACYLDPAAWGCGAGDPLLAAGEQRLREYGCDHAVLWVFEANGRARRFYERNGWTADGARDDFERDDWSAPEVRYRRSL